MQGPLIFDTPQYRMIDEARQNFLRKVLPPFKDQLQLGTALDAGCGVGYFSALLKEMGFRVVGFDGRGENVEEAKRHFPDIEFRTADVEDIGPKEFGPFDLVFCFGLLYHLENPFRAIRNLYTFTGKILFVESMFVPRREIALYLREEGHTRDQSSQYVAFYPTENVLVKMLYRAGFSFVYRFKEIPQHEAFSGTLFCKRMRTMFLATKEPLALSFLDYSAEPKGIIDPWITFWGKVTNPMIMMGRFLRKPWIVKMRIMHALSLRIWNRCFRGIPQLVRLRGGTWWLAGNDISNEAIVADTYEENERKFLGRFLKSDMRVLDIGAHLGFYSLLFSKKIGPGGKVIAFEPSWRERKRLMTHIRLNGSKNVVIEGVALSDHEGEEDFFVVDGKDTGCNSLRVPRVADPVRKVRVPVVSLDDYLARNNIEHVDFVKIDVEGGELGVLKGAVQLLERRPRPVMLIEVQDFRTQAWNYDAEEIIRFLRHHDFQWYAPLPDGRLEPIAGGQKQFPVNLIAIPKESIERYGA